MLCIIIIPRYTIIIKEGEKLITVLLKTLFIFGCYVALIIVIGKIFVEIFNTTLVFS
jgi:hypothetical protein